MKSKFLSVIPYDQIKIVFFITLLIILNPVYASSYKCTIESNHDLEDSGKLSSSDDWLKGKEFFIDKRNGITSGALSNHNDLGSPQILDTGSKDQAFQVLTIYRPIVAVDYLTVKEFVDSKVKPFLYIDSVFGVITGTCISY